MVTISLFSMYYGMILLKTGQLTETKLFFQQIAKKGFSSKIALASNYMKGLMSRPDHIYIDIKHNDYQKLEYERKRGLDANVLNLTDDDYVPASIRFKAETVRVKLRLKGDYNDHLIADQWSLRIKVRGDNVLFGMKNFSIQHPKIRNYIYEWIYHKALKREGVLAVRYRFIDVTINGKYKGVYALEEHFEKRLVEHAKRREGPIIRFNEDTMMRHRARIYAMRDSVLSGEMQFTTSEIDSFQTAKHLSDPTLLKLHNKAIGLLEAFRRGDLKTSEVFDIKMLARLWALADLFGAKHSTLWQNIMFYYNPITSKLEPIGYDGIAGRLTRKIGAISDFDLHGGIYIGYNSPKIYNDFTAMIFNDMPMYLEYIEALDRFVKHSYLDSFFDEINDELERELNILYKESPYFMFSTDIFYRNRQYIETIIRPTKGLNAYFLKTSNDYIELQLGNTQFVPIEIMGLSYDNHNIMPIEQIILPARVKTDSLVEYKNVRFKITDELNVSYQVVENLVLKYRVLGLQHTETIVVSPWPYSGGYLVKDDFVRQAPNIDGFSFISKDVLNKRLYIKSGSWCINKNLIIPAGFRVIAEKGTRINIMNSAKIISYSPFEFTGSQEKPIILYSGDAKGQGLVLMKTGSTSFFSNVVFDNLAPPSQSGWELSGAVTFYESPLEMSNCSFINSRSEDALNVIHSDFNITDTVFTNNCSDAFDSDFSNGVIKNTLYEDSGNDAIDVSGSKVLLQNISIKYAGDKGVSVGEESNVTITGIVITNTKTALASKDSSKLMGEDIMIKSANIGIATYKKKPEFGPANAILKRLSIQKVIKPFLVEKKSRLVLDGETIKHNTTNVGDLL